jgi:phosphocarrier protein HPr
MISKDYIITASDGIHARPATALIRLAKKFGSEIHLRKGNNSVKLKSMLNILAIGAKGGDIVTVVIEGEDEAIAAEAIDNFFTEELKKL